MSLGIGIMFFIVIVVIIVVYGEKYKGSWYLKECCNRKELNKEGLLGGLFLMF